MLKASRRFFQGTNMVIPYVVRDGNLITARYWHDAELFSEHFANELQQRMRGVSRL